MNDSQIFFKLLGGHVDKDVKLVKYGFHGSDPSMMAVLLYSCSLLWLLSVRCATVHSASRPHLAEMMGETGLSRGEKMKTIKFLLYTPNNPNNAKVLDMDDISSLAPVNIKWDTKVLIHGWKGDRTGFQKIKDAYLSTCDCNVIIVEWKELAKNMNYRESKAETEIVGTATAQLLDSLSDLGLPLSKVNCVGHSLGGHTAGVVGDRLTKGRLGMATGLDSAGPMFDSNKTPMKNKLDLNDAIFVQNVHTSIILGTKEFSGHSDFFPNGGMKQTGCKGAQEISYGLCSHMRVLDLWEETIRQPVEGRQCSSWDSYKSGKCDHSTVAVMGDNINRSARGLYFLETGESSPYTKMRKD